MTTRKIDLRTGVVRARETDFGTIVVRERVLRPPSTYRELFARYEREISTIVAAHPRRGLVAIALHPWLGVRGSLWLKAGPELRAGIIGRHSRADLMIADDPTLSLRHVLVLLRATSTHGVNFRIVDLRSRAGVTDEDGNSLIALEASGPLLIGVSEYVIAFIPTPGSAVNGGLVPIPPSVVVGVDDLARDTQSVAEPLAFAHQTFVTSHRGLVRAERARLVEKGERPLGTLIVRRGPREAQLVIGAQAAECGVLLGRAHRCAADLPTRVFDHPSLSRIHAVMFWDGEEMWWIDTASLNGTWLDDKRVKLVPLSDRMRLGLSAGMRVYWRYSSGGARTG